MPRVCSGLCVCVCVTGVAGRPAEGNMISRELVRGGDIVEVLMTILCTNIHKGTWHGSRTRRTGWVQGRLKGPHIPSPGDGPTTVGGAGGHPEVSEQLKARM